jgi:UDP-N-acetylglucosamine 2-epimerase (non-hydrolysing)/GDP/UDP-N,N'-diacetylbacillosamine 2-epimerase (hydrolysing)
VGELGVSDASGRPIGSVAVVTGSRAEYGLLTPVMREIARSEMQLRLVVTGMHLRSEYGATVDEVEADGFVVDARVEMTGDSDDHAGMVQSIALGIDGLGRALQELDVDAVLVLGDRVEAFAGAVAGAASNLVVGHIHGGEVSKGGLDESMRHAITKFAHLHFASTAENAQRIIRMGERVENVHNVGAPGLDSIDQIKRLTRPELERELGFSLQAPLLLLVQHPVTTTADTAASEMRASLDALRELRHQTICLYPNSDAGGRRMIDVIESYRAEPWLHVAPSLRHEVYLSLLAEADVMVGNSSSGIIEAPMFRLPVVNVGDRQAGRQRSENVIDVPPARDDIIQAVRTALSSKSFQARVKACRNPYGDGTAAAKIVDVLRRTRVTHDLLQKQLAY